MRLFQSTDYKHHKGEKSKLSCKANWNISLYMSVNGRRAAYGGGVVLQYVDSDYWSLIIAAEEEDYKFVLQSLLSKYWFHPAPTNNLHSGPSMTIFHLWLALIVRIIMLPNMGIVLGCCVWNESDSSVSISVLAGGFWDRMLLVTEFGGIHQRKWLCMVYVKQEVHSSHVHHGMQTAGHSQHLTALKPTEL